MRKKTKGVVTQRYIKKYTGEDGRLTISKSELARIIFQEEHGLFGSLNAARLSIRTYTGANGEPRREALKRLENIDPQIFTIKEGFIKRGLVQEASTLAKPVKLPEGKYLVLSDIHIPYQDTVALAAAVHYGVTEKVTGIVLNGDIVDCYYTSRYTKDTNRPSMKEEFKRAKAFFSYLRELFPTQPIWYKYGNHEERFREYILSKSREIENLDALTLEAQLSLKEFNIKPVGREIIQAGKLSILHGHEFGKSMMAPVNPARGGFIRAKSSVLFGHHHQTSEHSESNLKGEQTAAYSTGALCDLSPEYLPYGYTKWNHGAAIVTVAKNGMFKVRNFRIIEGEVY